jgi:hypothetical protein
MIRANLARANLARYLNELSLSWDWLDSARIIINYILFSVKL